MTVGIVDMDPDAAITRPFSHHYGYSCYCWWAVGCTD